MKILSLASGLFGAVVNLRNKIYDQRKVCKLSLPVISVGNLSAGGTGKTPFVYFLTKELKKHGANVGILSRGYKGTYKEKAREVDLGLADAAKVFGDEPTWFAKELNIPVYVARKRYDAKDLISKKLDVIVADDAFQHRALHRDIDIVLIDASDLPLKLIPEGRYREGLEALSRADIVVVTKEQFADSSQAKVLHKALGEEGFNLQAKNLFKMNYSVDHFTHINDKFSALRSIEKAVEFENIIIISSIAKPETVASLLPESSFVHEYVQKPDHYHWSQLDVNNIEKERLKLEVKTGKNIFVVTTEKDAVKLESLKIPGENWLKTILTTEVTPDLDVMQIYEVCNEDH